MDKATDAPAITRGAFTALARAELPWWTESNLCIDNIARGRAVLRMPFDDRMVRPGGTVSGPSMMVLADTTMYAVVLSLIGAVPLAVTTNLNINFLRRPPPADIRAEGTIIKLGKRLAVMQVTLYSEEDTDPVAHATGTYSVPPA